MQKEKVRVYHLARELNIDTADLLRLCKQAGFDVKNQLSSLDPDQQVKLEEMVKKSSKSAGPAAPAKPVTRVVSPDEKGVPNSAPPRPKREVEPRARKYPNYETESPPSPPPAPWRRRRAPGAARDGQSGRTGAGASACTCPKPAVLPTSIKERVIPNLSGKPAAPLFRNLWFPWQARPP